MPATPPTAVPGDVDVDGALLVRVPATDRTWVAGVPAVPGPWTLTVTVGHADLLPVAVDDLVRAGYRLAGVTAQRASSGLIIDILVPADLRQRRPDWWASLVSRADRVFDLRHGPVQYVLANEIELHLRASNH